jgi:hypothetical protein
VSARAPAGVARAQSAYHLATPFVLRRAFEAVTGATDVVHVARADSPPVLSTAVAAPIVEMKGIAVDSSSGKRRGDACGHRTHGQPRTSRERRSPNR